MNDKVYRVLEFDKVKDILKTYAKSPMGVDLIGELIPLKKAHEIRERLRETDEAVSVILAKGSLPLEGLYDIKRKVRYAEKGRILEMQELLEVASSLRVAAEIRRFLNDGALPEIPLLLEYSGFLVDLSILAERISGSILSADEMADTASPALRTIRRNMARQRQEARDRIAAMISSRAMQSILQDSVITVRDGRPVIPVRQEYRASVPGIVHDTSASGATLFIEPQVVVDINNKIRELEAQEREEILRILREYSAEIGRRARDIIRNQKYLARLDFIFAKAAMSVEHGCMAAEINQEGLLDIRQGRHPLIESEKVVPLDIRAGDGYRTLVITGPNTGGKTVALKTAGLLMLMNQAGMHIPAGPGTTLPVMKQIFADIGDEQSIEQSLSTFSSHMKKIVDISAQADRDSFILIDELGAGTDPSEGAALAVSILEYLAAKGSMIFATTHYSEVKKYAMSTDGVENASMEFDVEELRLTYSMIIGIPGKSNAFEIARKLGLEESVLEDAAGRISADEAKFEDLISEIEKERKQAAEELAEAQAFRSRMEQEKAELESRISADQEKSRKVLEKARQQASDMVAEARQFSEEMKKELRQLRKSSAGQADLSRQIEIRRKIREKTDQYREKRETFPVENKHPAKKSEIRLGDRVNVVSLGQKGIVAGLPDDHDGILVQIGIMKMRMPLTDIAVIDEHGVQKTFEKSQYGRMYRKKSMYISPEINVIGKHLDDALLEVDKYLDDAYMAGLSQVSVIHGRGTGALKNGLREMFRKHRDVQSFESASYDEGGEGVTIVTLKNT